MKKWQKRLAFWASLLAVVLLIFNVFWGVIFILLVGTPIGLYYVLRWLLAELAYRNILVTFRTEGEIKAIMKGDKCHHYVMAVQNHRIDPVDADIFKGSNEQYTKELLKTAVLKRAEDPGFIDNKLDEIVPKKGEKMPDFKKRVLGKYKQDPASSTEKPDTDPAKSQWWVLKPSFVEKLNKANDPSMFEEWFGVAGVGFPPFKTFVYQFRWIKYGQEKAADGKPSEKVGMHARDESVDSLYFRYPQYGIRADNFPTGAGSLSELAEEHEEKDQPKQRKKEEKPEESEEPDKKESVSIQVKLELVMETITQNPQKTLFRTAGLSSAGDWLNALTREVLDQVRSWVGTVDYDYLTTQKESVQKNLDNIRDLINNFDTKTRKRKSLDRNGSAVLEYGQEIFSIRLVKVIPTNEKIQQAVELIFAAEQDIRLARKQKQAQVIRAQGKRAEIAGPLLGQADGFEKIAGVLGREGMVRTRVAEEVGKLRGTYAPGKGAGLLLNVDTEGGGESPAPADTKESTS